ncbi:hypothetical protein FJV46_10760 [Arthrobacter agilis]|uniref:hypothetical protein n=1 Tax=Arthrobacter agilis TaxID=37921 RepID=UPI000B34EE10|nr:hypothetical protein [Arthrobacter agilis]OUM44143.1 hypothetical protein B8W74_04525 [Arthrobacter agilis]PPB46519.1 hypothetical protein CI784_06820 [Arthrobacter agilis]TPV23825.1 hypothetical protein FJV46_10760 [Arthrobacter agilis]VDR32560.1 Uncharacterised protein [Arthrobacter agilis]
MATPREKNFDGPVVDGAKKAVAYLDLKISDVAAKVASTPIKLPNGEVRPLGNTIGWIDNNQNANAAKIIGMLDGLTQTIAAQSTDPALSPAVVQKIMGDAAQKAFGGFLDQLRRDADAQGGEE